ncbi:hypothetical protein TNCV_1824281 [Trichonephila clavipes]|nr:hypothetical protein TNCV_1824281 [Trichonephila clavipes]
MSARHRLSDYDRERAVKRLEAGQSVTTVTAAMGVSKSIISRLKKVAEGGNALRNHAEADPSEAICDRSPRTSKIEEFSLPQQWGKRVIREK